MNEEYEISIQSPDQNMRSTQMFSPTDLLVELYLMELRGEDATKSALKKRLPGVDVEETINKCVDIGSIVGEFCNNYRSIKYVVYSCESREFARSLCMARGLIEERVK
jgi:hypothetical protein